jgi:hypothetical protein
MSERTRVHLLPPAQPLTGRLRGAQDGKWDRNLGEVETFTAAAISSLAALVDGAELAKRVFSQNAFEVDKRIRQAKLERGTWEGTAVELLIALFVTGGSWRFGGSPDAASLKEGQALVQALLDRIAAHPDEVEWVEPSEP